MRYFSTAVLSLCCSLSSLNAHGFGSDLNVCTPPVTASTLVSPKIVGDGTAASCTDTALQVALSGGGHIAFNCGASPVTIAINSTLQLEPEAEETVIDGGGLITLDGGNAQRIMEKAWHVGEAVRVIKLQNISLINGRSPLTGTDGQRRGGAVYIRGTGNRFYAINSSFVNNNTSDPTIEDDQGGAIYTEGSYEVGLIGSTFNSNTAGSGGAFGAIAAGLLIYNSYFSGNQAVDSTTGGVVRGHGGAIHLDGVTNASNPNSNHIVHVCGSVFENNSATRGGGALKVTVSDNKGTKAIYEQSIFRSNHVTGSSTEQNGGAIYHIEDDFDGGDAEDNIAILNNVFYDNSSPMQGGAVWLSVNGRGTVENTTFFNNQVNDLSTGMGGALVLARGEISVLNSTFAENYAWFHGAGIQATTSAVLTLKNSLFYYNSSERDWARYPINRAADVDGGGNIQYPATRFNQISTPNDELITPTALREDPMLLDLADNGGNVLTMALASSSPAIGLGTGCPSSDARGAARGTTCSSGAYEADSIPSTGNVPTFTSTPPTSEVLVGATYLYNISTQELDGDVVSITASGLPAWLQLTDNGNGTAVLTGTPALTDVGNTVISVMASDAQGSNVQGFLVSVVEQATTPTDPSDPTDPSTPDTSDPTTPDPTTPSEPVAAAPSCPETGTVNISCNASGAELAIEQISSRGTVANALLSGVVTNEGWAISVHVLPDAELHGGIVSGIVVNEGLMQDFEFRGGLLSGGTLGGVIINNSTINGTLQDVQFAADASLSGGVLAGEISGNPVAPVLLSNVRIAANTQLNHVILGENVTLADSVSFGEGVRYQSQLTCQGSGWVIDMNGAFSDAASDGSCFERRAEALVTTVNTQHRGQQGEAILVGISAAGEAFSHDGTAWQLIPADLAEILPLWSYSALPLTVELPVDSFLMSDRSDVAYFFGYRLADGTIVFTEL